jgi:hypothetical protein
VEYKAVKITPVHICTLAEHAHIESAEVTETGLNWDDLRQRRRGNDGPAQVGPAKALEVSDAVGFLSDLLERHSDACQLFHVIPG